MEEMTSGVADLVAVTVATAPAACLTRDQIREVIRDLLPAGRSRKSRTRHRGSDIGNQIGRAYRKFEGRGWLLRDGDFIRVVNRRELLRWVSEGEPSPERRVTLERARVRAALMGSSDG